MLQELPTQVSSAARGTWDEEGKQTATGGAPVSAGVRVRIITNNKPLWSQACAGCFTRTVSFYPQELIIPIVQVRTLSLREVWSSAQGHTAGGCQSQVLSWCAKIDPRASVSWLKGSRARLWAVSNGDSGKFTRTQGTAPKSCGDMPCFPLPVREPESLVPIVKEEFLKFSLELWQNSMGSFRESIRLWVFFGGKLLKFFHPYVYL